MAADPSASGMSDGGQGWPTGRDILLTAVVDEQIHDKVLHFSSRKRWFGLKVNVSNNRNFFHKLYF